MRRVCLALLLVLSVVFSGCVYGHTENQPCPIGDRGGVYYRLRHGGRSPFAEEAYQRVRAQIAGEKYYSIINAERNRGVRKALEDEMEKNWR